MPPVGFEPAIPAVERPQTHALDRAATGTGLVASLPYELCNTEWKFYLRPALFWDFTHRGIVIPYRRFGVTCLSHLQGSGCLFGRLELEDGNDRFSRNVGTELLFYAA